MYDCLCSSTSALKRDSRSDLQVQIAVHNPDPHTYIRTVTGIQNHVEDMQQKGYVTRSSICPCTLCNIRPRLSIEEIQQGRASGGAILEVEFDKKRDCQSAF